MFNLNQTGVTSVDGVVELEVALSVGGTVIGATEILTGASGGTDTFV
jgi:hypothetical protein